MALFEIKNLSFAYPEAATPALKEISLTIEEGSFVTLCGPSGSGKTTLLRLLKPSLMPHGILDGEMLYKGKPLSELSKRQECCEIGFVFQDPDNQIVTDKVWHELAFGMENLGFDRETIRLRVSEMATFFGISDWFLKDTSTLSGGQKQLLSLAAVMTLQPAVLILDEPTSQLDPIAADNFLNTLQKIHQEFGTTILLSEHRLEDVLHRSDRVVVLEDGGILADGSPREVSESLLKSNHRMAKALPVPAVACAKLTEGALLPLTVREGRKCLARFSEKITHKTVTAKVLSEAEPLLTIKNISFRYEKEGKDILSDLTMTIEKGRFYGILGANGAGKSTLLSCIIGAFRPYRGKIAWADRKNPGKVALLPQHVSALFTHKTVEEDLLEVAESREEMLQMAREFEIDTLLSKHPYDLSGGELQRAALCKVLLTKPELLLMDEPTKGLDSLLKEKLAAYLKSLGITIFMVSHDVEFCAEYADKCALMFLGEIMAEEETNAFFSGNAYYTTAANRMTRGLFENAVTREDVTALCQKNQIL